MDLTGGIICAMIAAAGLGLALKALVLRDWLHRVYGQPRMTAHLHMPGYVLSLRLIGVAVFVGGSVLLMLGLTSN